jgi:hypothetical protein
MTTDPRTVETRGGQAVTTTPQQPPQPLTRIAGSYGTCPNCTVPIKPGTRIEKPPGQPWQHARCPVLDRPPRVARFLDPAGRD